MDDHDRSGRYTCRDFGQNYLNSMDAKGNPVIFTNGDNDTFPLWYNQETEGVRTDARVCNLSYLQTDWYIDQMRRPAYDSPSLPISWTRLQYVTGTREGIPVQPDALQQVIDYYKDSPEDLKQMLGDNPYELKNIIRHWVLNDNPDLQIFPTDSIVVTVDKEAVKRSGMMIAADSIPDVMHISQRQTRHLQERNDDAGNDFAGQLGTPALHVYDSRSRQLRTSGRQLRTGRPCLPHHAVRHQTERPAPSTARECTTNMMNKFKYGGLKENPDIYLDETVIRMCYTHRRLFNQLAQQLLKEGQKDKALKVLQRAEEEIPAASSARSLLRPFARTG